MGKKCITADNHAGMVHSITQLAFFGNGLFSVVVVYYTGAACFNKFVLVNVYHILTCHKADQQYP